MDKMITTLMPSVPGIKFQSGNAFYWSPKHKSITYKPDNSEESIWALLHETAHALLGHKDYDSDLELLLLEVAAWAKACEVARDLGVDINEEHIQDCLDTYRDWLHQRSTCPRCSVVSLQVSASEYGCHNCDARWRVSTSRFCRPYRLSKHAGQIKSHPETQATFI